MPRLTDVEIESALAVCKKATPGPWISVDEDWDGDGYQEPVLVTENDKQIAEVRVGLKGTVANQEFIALARTLLPRALEELREARKDTDLLDGAADIRIVDGFGDMDIDEMTSASLPKDASFDDEGKWKLEWRKQFRVALRAAIDAARGSK